MKKISHKLIHQVKQRKKLQKKLKQLEKQGWVLADGRTLERNYMLFENAL